MKKYLAILMTVALSYVAQAEIDILPPPPNNGPSTNVVPPQLTIGVGASTQTNGWPMELMLGAGGFSSPTTGKTEAGANLSLSMQPFKQPIWFGISQEIGWQPSLAGATDLDALYAKALYKDKLYANVGWSAGSVYDSHTLAWRSGPEVQLEYYLPGNTFISFDALYNLLHTGAVEPGISWGVSLGYAF